MAIKTVWLKDEHKQEIRVNVLAKHKVWWGFPVHGFGAEIDWNGPFKSEQAAIGDAQAFCDEGAAGE